MVPRNRFCFGGPSLLLQSAVLLLNHVNYSRFRSNKAIFLMLCLRIILPDHRGKRDTHADRAGPRGKYRTRVHRRRFKQEAGRDAVEHAGLYDNREGAETRRSEALEIRWMDWQNR